jgi:DNA adenine methylase
MQAKPFLKWAGGKSQLLEQIANFLPEELIIGSIKKYIEPFIGGGAVFLHLAQCYKIEEFLIFDINTELVLAYKTIQNHVDELIHVLLNLQNKYLSLDEQERTHFFYEIRTQFNRQRHQIDFQKTNQQAIERTAQIIFLNRTCFNGLFRVNSKGDFNVPVGRYKNPTICDSENLKAVSQVLQRTQIYQGDFTECERFVDQYSLVYFDPPYRPLSRTANFTAYAQQTFDDTEQLRLRDFFALLDRKGAKLILSNSDPKNKDLTDDFFEIAYGNYQLKRVQAKRRINCNASKREEINELLITNY